MQAMLLWYARHVPYHPYKQQISKRMRQLFQISLTGKYVETRGGLHWAMDAAEIREVLRCITQKVSVMFDLGANFGY